MTTNNSVNTSLSGQTGTGSFVGSTSPTLVTPALGTPSSGSLGSCTATTQSANNNSTSLATTAYVDRGAGSGMVLISAQTVSNQANVSFTSLAGESYSSFVVEFNNVLPPTSGQQLAILISTGSGFIAGSNYWYNAFRQTASASAVEGVAGTGAWELTSSAEPIGNTANSSEVNGRVQIYSVGTTTSVKGYSFNVLYLSTTPNKMIMNGSGQVTSQAAVVDGIKIQMTAGNISGNFYLYGLRNS